MRRIEVGDLVFVRYRDHVAFFKSEPLAMAPQTRECVGWLVHNTPDYVPRLTAESYCKVRFWNWKRSGRYGLFSLRGSLFHPKTDPLGDGLADRTLFASPQLRDLHPELSFQVVGYDYVKPAHSTFPNEITFGPDDPYMCVVV